MRYLIEYLDGLASWLSDIAGVLPLSAESSLRMDEGASASWLSKGDSKLGRIMQFMAWLAAFALAAVGFWRWRRPLRQQVGQDDEPAALPSTANPQVTALRQRHGQHRNLRRDLRTDSLMAFHQLYTQGKNTEVYEGLKRHLEAHPFELNFYIVCLNILAEKGRQPSPEMIRLIRHALRQLKVHRPRVWQNVAEHGRRVLPDFDHWDEKASLSVHRHPHL